MKNHIKLFMALFVLLLGFGCHDKGPCINGSGNQNTMSFQVAPFTGINIVGAADVHVRYGTTQSVTVSGHQNILNELQNDVLGNTWQIELNNDHCYRDYNLTVDIEIPELEKLGIEGSGEIDVYAFPNMTQLDVTIDGSGEVSIMDAIENVSELDISITGSGEYNGYLLKTDTCTIHLNGSGDCKTYVNDLLDVTISGSGVVKYKGSPTIQSNISGSGEILDAN